MSQDYTDALLRDIARETKTIVMAGASANPARPSFGVMRFLQRSGYRLIPVNPAQAGKIINGATIVADFAAIPKEVGDIQMLAIFRRPEAVLPVVRSAIDHLLPRGLRTIWMQLGVVSDEAAEIARSAGLNVVMNRCPTIEWPQFLDRH